MASALRMHAREILWGLLLVLSAALISFPKHLILEYSPVESLNVFSNLSMFAALHYLWMATLIAIILIPRGSGSMPPWEGMALVSVFALVYRGMWDIVLPDWWGDGLLNIVTSQFIIDTGRILQSNPNIGNLDFPGLDILAASLSQVTGLSLFPVVAVLLLLLDVLMASSLYLVCFGLLRDTRMASLAALLGLLGSVFFATLFFYAAFLGLVFLSIFVFLAIERGHAMTARDWSLSLLLLTAATITHFVTSEAFVLVLLGISVVGYLGRRIRVPVSAYLLFFLVPATWVVFHARYTSQELALMVSHAPAGLADTSARKSDTPLFFWVLTMVKANLGEGNPFWATATKLFWLVTLYGLGTGAVLSGLLRRKSLTTGSHVAIGAFLGVTVLSLANTLTSTGGFEFFRFLAFAPLFTAPFLVMLLGDMMPFRAKTGLAALGLTVVLLSYPTFLAHHARVEQYAFYPDEYAASQFISSAFPDRQLRIYTSASALGPLLLHNMRANYWIEGQASVDLHSASGLWNAVSAMWREFHKRQVRWAVFMFSQRPIVYYQHVFRIQPANPHWLELEENLETTNLVYDSRSVRLYTM